MENRIENERKFWDAFALEYDGFIRRTVKKTYDSVIKHLCDDISPTDHVLEIATGTGIISFAIRNNKRQNPTPLYCRY